MKKNLSVEKQLLIWSLFIIFFTVLTFYKNGTADLSIADVKANKLVGYAIVKEVQQNSYRGGGRLYCEMHLQDSVFSYTYGYGSTIGCKKQLLNIHLPVFYSKINKSNYFILVTEDDFEKFDMQQPDSLKWLNKCF
jgi:hypothetical protein